jgi:hypothetical protein
MKIIFPLVKFLLLGSFFIISNHNIHLNHPAERAEFFSICNVWFSNLFDNAKTVTGYVAKLEWMPIDSKLFLPIVNANSIPISLLPN